MTPRPVIRSSWITADRSAAPRQPSIGRANLATSRSVNGASRRRANETGSGWRVTSMRALCGRSNDRRPSAQSTPCFSGAHTLDDDALVGAVTSGRANSAWALSGTSSSASTSGHTTGPPAENE